MNIIVRDVFKSGRCCGRLYDTADIEEGQGNGEKNLRSNLRVIRRSENLYEILPAKDWRGLQFAGRWTFTSKVFREFDSMVRCWLKKRFEFGAYRGFWTGGSHSSHSYYRPGNKSGIACDSDACNSIHRETRRLRIADGFTARAVFTNSKKHTIALAFDWKGMGLYWTRDCLGLIRDRALTKEEETTLVQCNMTIQDEEDPKEYMVLHEGDALYIREVAQLVKKK